MSSSQKHPACIGWWALYLSAGGVAVYAVLFVAIRDLSDEFIQLHGTEYDAAFFLLTHIICGAIALSIGPFQFSQKLRQQHKKWHRRFGYIYLCSICIGTISSFIAAQQALTGSIAQLGFSALALAWGYTTTMAFLAIRRGDFLRHENWMKRSYALTLAAVSLRIMLGATVAMQLPFAMVYPVIAWACWVPNLIIAERYWVKERA